MSAISHALSFAVLTASVLHAQPHTAWTTTSEVFATTEPARTDHSIQAMVSAAGTFLGSLSEDEKKQALLPLSDPERRKWTNVPPGKDDGGIRLGDLSKAQLENAVAFLSTVMSREGFLKIRNIMLADDILLDSREQAESRGGFGAANYWIAIFGEPSETEPWGVQWDGHHVAINLTIHGERVSMTPSFIGTQPHAFTLDGRRIVPMQQETALAYEFVHSLDADQQAAAIVGDTRGRMLAGAGKDGFQPDPRGLDCSKLTGEQRARLLKLVELWVNDLPTTPAKARMGEIEAQLDRCHFAWHGPIKEGSDISYHLTGPGIIIEYAGQDLGGDPLDHLHSIYRDPANEYGGKGAE